jgi:hypothetical protein
LLETISNDIELISSWLECASSMVIDINPVELEESFQSTTPLTSFESHSFFKIILI